MKRKIMVIEEIDTSRSNDTRHTGNDTKGTDNER